ncbi:hypothetical protein WMF45_33710 [Sorangium sp. So ce448]|uniref:hypothetical protein n=1 Tax=Sorangium sp. So ce448 TaxID=3133314 RepID=UPI003F5E3255
MANYYSNSFQFPPDVVQHLRQFDSLPEAWEHSTDGACMLWLARSMANAPGQIGCVSRGALHAATTIDELIDTRHEVCRDVSDPICLGYFHARDAMYAAAGVEDRPWPEPGPRADYESRPQDERAYAAAVAEARALAADVLRGRRLLEEMLELAR